MKRLIVATGNRGKLREIAEYLHGLVEDLSCLADFPGLPPIVEDGSTFLANALIKARTVGEATGLPTLADDSGLSVQALDGRPGVHSARFAGEYATDAENNALLLRELASVPADERTAAFHCALVLWLPDGTYHAFDGILAGEILMSPRGSDGFGYDPLFLVPELGRTLAEIPVAEKNGISHRGRALAELRRFLETGRC